jgi:ESCRT-II complex subunit VPS22
MRRKVGVSAVKKKKDEADQYNIVGKMLKDTKITFVQDVMKSFKNSLAEFATKHRDRINSDPEFRQQFHVMCISAGVDPLASSKGFWSDILGVGDFYFELGVKIIKLTVQTRNLNGGIISIRELLEKIKNSDKNLKHEISLDDIKRSIEKLTILGNGLKIVNISDNPVLISVPMEINTDHESLMVASQRHDGCVNQGLMQQIHGWNKQRFELNINHLMLEGIVWLDFQAGF